MVTALVTERASELAVREVFAEMQSFVGKMRGQHSSVMEDLYSVWTFAMSVESVYAFRKRPHSVLLVRRRF